MGKKTKRRGQGEGSVYQRADGKWEGVISLGWRTDPRTRLRTRQRRKVVRNTQREALAALAQLRGKHGAGALPIERRTVEEFLYSWLSEVVQPQHKPATIAQRQSHVQLHIVPTLGTLQLAALTPERCQRWANALRVSPATARTIIGTLKSALGIAVAWGLLDRNPVAGVRPPKGAAPRKPAYLTVDQAHALLGAATGDRLEALWRLLLGLGLRRGEVLALQWSDWNEQAGRLAVRGNMQVVNGRPARITPKSTSSERELPVPESLSRALKVHRVQQRQEQLLSGDANWNRAGLMFPTSTGRASWPCGLDHRFKTLLKRAGLPATIRLHDLRHSCAAFLIADKVHPRVIMEILGHSQISTTMNIYGHLIDELDTQAIEGVDRRLRDVSGL